MTQGSEPVTPASVFASDPDAFTEPWLQRRAAAYADDLRAIVERIAEYENAHPDDAPCLHGQHVEIDGKQVTIKVHEWGIR